MTMIIFYSVLIYLLLGASTALLVLIRPKIILDAVYQDSSFRTRLVLVPGMIVLWPVVLVVLMRVQNGKAGFEYVDGKVEHE